MDINEVFAQALGIEVRGTSSPVAMSQPSFMDMLHEELVSDEKTNVSYTENGARGFKTTGKALLDLNFAVASLRQCSPREIATRFLEAYGDGPLTAWKWLFFLRDVRGGLGERRSFRAIIVAMADEHPKEMMRLLPLIYEYGRWDDYFVLLNNDRFRPVVCQMIKEQLLQDVEGMKQGKPISLLAKWLPSINSHSKQTRQKALCIIQEIGLTERVYRKLSVELRRYLRVVEVPMSAQEWDQINYNTVPAKANLQYNKAFLRHDEERRTKWLQDLQNHKEGVKINASTLFPHDIVHQYTRESAWGDVPSAIDPTLEELWKALPNTLGETNQKVMVVADGSGSMLTRIDPQGRTTALDVANALAIYFSERNVGPYKDQYITFSMNPQYVNLKGATTLQRKLQIASKYHEVANTDIKAVFDMILMTAQKNHLRQKDIPDTILIISDMEFDHCARCPGERGRHSYYGSPVDATLFDTIRKGYTQAGYQLPRLVFWNVNSRTQTIPVRENSLGVALVSGFSTNVVNMVLSNELDPYKALLAQLNTARYQPIEDTLKQEGE